MWTLSKGLLRRAFEESSTGEGAAGSHNNKSPKILYENIIKMKMKNKKKIKKWVDVYITIVLLTCNNIPDPMLRVVLMPFTIVT